MKKVYIIPVRFTGRREYEIVAESEKQAMAIANEYATEETEFNKLEDIDFEVSPANEVITINED